MFSKQPQIISLTEIERCTLGESGFFSGYPIDVHTGKAMHRFYVFSWMRATRNEATKRMAAIAGEVSTVKAASGE
jgi:hypothetical protein